MTPRLLLAFLLVLAVSIVTTAYIITQSDKNELLQPHIDNNDIDYNGSVTSPYVAFSETTTLSPTVSESITDLPTRVATEALGSIVTPKSPDITKDLEDLGNPFLARYSGQASIYPRNVWDMQLFGNKIFMGSGNSSNYGPHPNAGPVDVWAYDLATEQFVEELTVDEEQVDVFRILNGTLYIPGHDPRRNHVAFYHLDHGRWTENSNISHFYHVYDMFQHGPVLFAALGTESGAQMAMSSDSGENWTKLPMGWLRTYTLFAVDGTIFAVKSVYTDAGYEVLPKEYQPHLIGVYQYQDDRNFAARPDLKFSVLFPGYDGDIHPENPWYTTGKIVRHVNFLDKLIYIGGNFFNDHHSVPFGLFAAGPIEQVRRIELPDGTLPWDTLIRGDTLYVLLGAKQPDETYQISVISTNDLVQWSEVLHFFDETFARSFEMSEKRDFYFGLGTGIPTGLELNDPSTWEMSDRAGVILRISHSAWQRAD